MFAFRFALRMALENGGPCWAALLSAVVIQMEGFFASKPPAVSRTGWVGRDLRISPGSDGCFTSSWCSKPCPAWPWTLAGMGHPQLLQAACFCVSPPSRPEAAPRPALVRCVPRPLWEQERGSRAGGRGEPAGWPGTEAGPVVVRWPGSPAWCCGGEPWHGVAVLGEPPGTLIHFHRLLWVIGSIHFHRLLWVTGWIHLHGLHTISRMSDGHGYRGADGASPLTLPPLLPPWLLQPCLFCPI